MIDWLTRLTKTMVHSNWLGITGLVAVIVASASCTGKGLAKDVSDDENEISSNKAATIRTYRKGIMQTGTCPVSLEHMPMKYPGLIQISDHGSILYQPNRTVEKYSYIRDGIETEISRDRNSPYDNPCILPNGSLCHTPYYGFGNSQNFPILNEGNLSLIFDDTSYLRIDAMNVPGEKRSTFLVKRDWHEVSQKPDRFGNRDKVVRSQTLFSAHESLSFLEKTEVGDLWIQDHDALQNRGTDKLIRLSDGHANQIHLPDGYKNVARISQTGNDIAGTFGKKNGEQPFRSFILAGNNWRELPTPLGFDYAFVQKVFTEGSIIGYVTSADLKTIRAVLWKGDQLSFLDEVKGWPKETGATFLPSLANRNGLICLEKVTRHEEYIQVNNQTQYLLKVSTNKP
jgi:hypothetical protein